MSSVACGLLAEGVPLAATMCGAAGAAVLYPLLHKYRADIDRSDGACMCVDGPTNSVSPCFYPKNVHQPWPLALKSQVLVPRATGDT